MKKQINLTGLEEKRAFEIRATDFNDEDRTVAIAFSSELPYRRWYGNEILLHGKENVLLERLNNNAAFLMNHEYSKQIGVVVAGSARVDDDKIGRCIVRFSKTELNKDAQQCWEELKEGIKTKVSVGYKINKYSIDVDEAGNETDTYRVTEWEPLEVSIVSVPADDTVGVGRSLDIENIKITKEVKKMEEKDLVQAERERIQKIEAAYEKFQNNIGGGLKSVKDSYIREGKEYREFFDYCLEKMDTNKPIEMPKTHLDLSTKEKSRYSIRAAITNLIDKRFEGTFEAEVHNEIAKRVGGAKNGGFFLPYDLQRASIGTSIVDTPKGGYLVGTDHLADQYIAPLRNTSVLDKLGARRLTGLTGNIDIPVMVTGATFSFVAEGSPASQSLQAFGQKTASPKTGTANTEYTRKLLMQSSPSIDALINEDLNMIAALGVDAAAINGTGLNNQPTGLLATTGIGSVDGAAGISITEILEFRSDIRAANGDRSEMAWAMNPDVEAVLMGTEKASGYPVYIMSEDGKIMGSPSVVSNQIASQNLILGCWNELIICEFGVLEILVNPYNAGGNVKVELFKDMDVIVRYPSSFSASINVSLT